MREGHERPFTGSGVGSWRSFSSVVEARARSARHPHSRRCASMNASRAGQVEANASFTRRMLTVTCAPIFKSCSRIVPHVTRSKSVPTSPMRRSASIGTKANDDTPDALGGLQPVGDRRPRTRLTMRRQSEFDVGATIVKIESCKTKPIWSRKGRTDREWRNVSRRSHLPARYSATLSTTRWAALPSHISGI